MLFRSDLTPTRSVAAGPEPPADRSAWRPPRLRRCYRWRSARWPTQPAPHCAPNLPWPNHRSRLRSSWRGPEARRPPASSSRAGLTAWTFCSPEHQRWACPHLVSTRYQGCYVRSMAIQQPVAGSAPQPDTRTGRTGLVTAETGRTHRSARAGGDLAMADSTAGDSFLAPVKDRTNRQRRRP